MVTVRNRQQKLLKTISVSIKQKSMRCWMKIRTAVISFWLKNWIMIRWRLIRILWIRRMSRLRRTVHWLKVSGLKRNICGNILMIRWLLPWLALQSAAIREPGGWKVITMTCWMEPMAGNMDICRKNLILSGQRWRQSMVIMWYPPLTWISSGLWKNMWHSWPRKEEASIRVSLWRIRIREKFWQWLIHRPLIWIHRGICQHIIVKKKLKISATPKKQMPFMTYGGISVSAIHLRQVQQWNHWRLARH